MRDGSRLSTAVYLKEMRLHEDLFLYHLESKLTFVDIRNCWNVDNIQQNSVKT